MNDVSGHPNDPRIPQPVARGWPWALVQAVLPGFLLVGKAPPGPERDVLGADQPMRRCSRCGVLKSIDRYKLNRSEPGGRSRRCRDCFAAYRRTRRQDPAVRARQRAARRRWYARHRLRQNARQKAARERLRTEVLLAYGHRCDCCAEAAREFLGVDHVRGGGRQHRKRLRLGGRFYDWLKRQGFPRDEFRLLCHNCNVAKGLYGHCPHEQRAQG